MILIITNKNDTHSDEVVRRLGKREVPVFRLNTEDVLEKYRTSLNIDGSGNWSGRILDELDRSLTLSELRVAWVRRPDFAFRDPHDGVQEFVASEVKALVSCIYAIPDVTFVNEVFDSDRAKTKFQQLIIA